MIKEILENIRDPILDIGHNQGVLHLELKKKFKNIYGIDVAVKKKERNTFKMDAQKMTFPKNKFNAIVAGEVIEHLKDPPAFIKSCKGILKPKGILIISTPNKQSWWNKITGSYEHKEHVSLQSPESLEKLLEENSFEIEAFYFIPFDQYTSGRRYGFLHFYFFRRIMSKIIPKDMRENMFVVAKNNQPVGLPEIFL